MAYILEIQYEYTNKNNKYDDSKFESFNKNLKEIKNLNRIIIDPFFNNLYDKNGIIITKKN
jgi:hypothetical protein